MRFTLLHPDPARGPGPASHRRRGGPGHHAGQPAARAVPRERLRRLGGAAPLAVADVPLDDTTRSGSRRSSRGASCASGRSRPAARRRAGRLARRGRRGTRLRWPARACPTAPRDRPAVARRQRQVPAVATPRRRSYRPPARRARRLGRAPRPVASLAARPPARSGSTHLVLRRARATATGRGRADEPRTCSADPPPGSPPWSGRSRSPSPCTSRSCCWPGWPRRSSPWSRPGSAGGGGAGRARGPGSAGPRRARRGDGAGAVRRRRARGRRAAVGPGGIAGRRRSPPSRAARGPGRRAGGARHPPRGAPHRAHAARRRTGRGRSGRRTGSGPGALVVADGPADAARRSPAGGRRRPRPTAWCCSPRPPPTCPRGAARASRWGRGRCSCGTPTARRASSRARGDRRARGRPAARRGRRPRGRGRRDARGALPDRASLGALDGIPAPDGGRRRVGPRRAPGLVAALGVGADGRPLHVDLVADGPHALVAGTTGAGKSELLATLVLALALTHPPDRLAMLLVDFKGGTGLGPVAGLPHVARARHRPRRGARPPGPDRAARRAASPRARPRRGRRPRPASTWTPPTPARPRACSSSSTSCARSPRTSPTRPARSPGSPRRVARSACTSCWPRSAPPVRSAPTCARTSRSGSPCGSPTSPTRRTSSTRPTPPGSTRATPGPRLAAPAARGTIEAVQVARAVATRRGARGPARPTRGRRSRPGRPARHAARAADASRPGCAAAGEAARRAHGRPDRPGSPRCPRRGPRRDDVPRRRRASRSPSADLPDQLRRGAVRWDPAAGHLLVLGGPRSGRSTTLLTAGVAALEHGLARARRRPALPTRSTGSAAATGTAGSGASSRPTTPAAPRACCELLAAPAGARALLLVDRLDLVLESLGRLARGAGADRLDRPVARGAGRHRGRGGRGRRRGARCSTRARSPSASCCPCPTRRSTRSPACRPRSRALGRTPDGPCTCIPRARSCARSCCPARPRVRAVAGATRTGGRARAGRCPTASSSRRARSPAPGRAPGARSAAAGTTPAIVAGRTSPAALLVAGPPGSGRTSTLAVLARSLVARRAPRLRLVDPPGHVRRACPASGTSRPRTCVARAGPRARRRCCWSTTWTTWSARTRRWASSSPRAAGRGASVATPSTSGVRPLQAFRGARCPALLRRGARSCSTCTTRRRRSSSGRAPRSAWTRAGRPPGRGVAAGGGRDARRGAGLRSALLGGSLDGAR